MADSPQLFADAILALLRSAREAGAGKLTRTQLVKFLYLLDLYTAEERDGQTFTGAQWRFLHFGPYAAELDAKLDELASQGAIQSESRENVDKEYSLFYLGEWSTAKSLDALGISYESRTKLAEMLKAYSFDLPGLLNHVYFDTSPMIEARPGDVLDFSKAERPNWARDVKPHRFGVADKKKSARIKELVAALGEARRQRAFELKAPPVYDEHYFRAMADEQSEGDPGRYSAKLHFE